MNPRKKIPGSIRNNGGIREKVGEERGGGISCRSGKNRKKWGIGSEKFGDSEILVTFALAFERKRTCGNSSGGRAQPCQGWGRGSESRFPLSKAVWKDCLFLLYIIPLQDLRNTHSTKREEHYLLRSFDQSQEKGHFAPKCFTLRFGTRNHNG